MGFKVLLFGRGGQLGTACCQRLDQGDIELVALDREKADFADPEAVYRVVRDIQPEFVVNTCAYTAVDKAESDRELAFRVNGVSVGRLAEACSELDIPLLHVSTDYVFSGNSDKPYCEDDPVDPASVYGASKLEGERLLQGANSRHILLRTSWVFGEHGNNFVKTMLRLGRERDELGIVADQVGCPTYSGDLAAVIAACIKQYRACGSFAWGTYHCSNAGACSWYDFAEAIFAEALASGYLQKVPQLRQLTTDQYPTAAPRPRFSVLDCRKLETLLGAPMPPWKAGLEKVCRALAAG